MVLEKNIGIKYIKKMRKNNEKVCNTYSSL